MSQETEGIQSAVVPYAQLTPLQQKQRLKELALIFLKLGTVAFGGPAAHIAIMDDEVVKRRQWMSRERLLDLLGVTNLIPGPNSSELAIHIGYERAGWRGLIIAGSCFILPAMLIVWLLAAIYVRYQTVPALEWVLYGVKPVIMAIVVRALWQLGKKAAKDLPTVVAGVAVIVAFSLGVNEILLLLLAGLGVMLVKMWRSRSGTLGALLLPSGFLASAPLSPYMQAGSKCSCSFSKSAQSCTAVAMSCLPSCSGSWWNKTIGSPPSNFWMQLPLVR